MSAKLPLDPEARRQLLLTRIAFERDELRRDVDRLRQATTLPHLVRTLLGLRPGSGWFGGSGGPDALGRDGWIATALAWLRRYRLASSVLGALFGGTGRGVRQAAPWPLAGASLAAANSQFGRASNQASRKPFRLF